MTTNTTIPRREHYLSEIERIATVVGAGDLTTAELVSLAAAPEPTQARVRAGHRI